MTGRCIWVFVEEPSAKAALELLLPRILGHDAFHIVAFRDKGELLREIGKRLKGLSGVSSDLRIAVLVDRDDDNCLELKAHLEARCAEAGLTSRSRARGDTWRVVNRIACEELEAWFLGDVAALRAAYPRVPATLGEKSQFRDPDAVVGGTWEALARVLQAAGHFPNGLRKIEAARAVAAHMNPSTNRSRSFQVFREAIAEMNAT